MSGKSTLYSNLSYKDLYTELLSYERSGISLLIDGSTASPMQVVQAYMTKEEGSYMRDYEMDPEGYIKTLSFVDINKKGEHGQPQPPYTQTGENL
ncbi:MAG: hypothetical protein SOY12_03935 [Schaedlerella sp.]|nr:hypothetical protein [Lachnospiraceae bacterium]MDY4202187.1 hypothetical protein [Schaedlerella sp.]